MGAVGSNPSDKYLNTKIPKCLNKSILDASEKNGGILLRFGEMVASQMMKGSVKIQYGCTIDIFEILLMLVLFDLELI